MKKVLLTVGLIALVPAGYAMGAMTISFANSYGDNGGEFVATPSLNISVARLDVASPKFETFCVEKPERLSFNVTYNFSVDAAVIVGGAGGGSPDPLAAETQWLYWKFITGSLTGYDYTAGAGRVASANALQNVIWWYENEIVNKYQDLATQAEKDLVDDFITLATGQAGVASVKAINPWSLTDLAGHGFWNPVRGVYEYQSVLVAVPAPGAAALVLAGFALVGWVKRRA